MYRNFTEGQGSRMRTTIEEIRSSLLESQGCKDPCTIPIIAAFSASATTVFTGESVVFTNQSFGASTYEWSINDSVFSNLPSPSYTFQEVGFFEIKLRVNNSDPNCEAIMKMTIHVNCSVHAGFTVNSEALGVGEILNCTNTTIGVSTQQQWYINGVAVGDNTDMTYTFSVPGFYTVLLQTGNSSCVDVHSIGINVTDPTGCSLYQDGVYLEMNVQGYKPIYFNDLHPNGTIYRDYYGSNKSTVIKTDLLGNLIWAKNYNHNFGRYMVTDDGGILGYFFGGYLDDPTFVKLSPEGNVEWVNQITYSVPPNLYYRAIGNKAFIFSESLFDPFQVVLFAEDGSVLWNKSYETLDGLHMQDACASYDNAAIWISGSSWISTDGGVILKMDNQGNPIFIKKFSANPSEHVEFTFIKATPDNGFVALGRVTMTPNSNLLLVKGDTNGNIQWTKMVDLEEVAFTWLFVKPDGGYWVGSHTSTAYRPVWLSFSATGELLFARETYHVDGTPAEVRAVRSVLGKPFGMLRLYYKPAEDPVVEMSESAGVKLSCITHKEVVEPCIDFTFTISDIVATPSQQTLQITGSSLLEVPLTTNINKLSLCDGVDEPCPESCANSLDDDEDGYVDCFDSDCQCFDGVDCNAFNSPKSLVFAKIAWQSPTDIVSAGATPIIADLNPLADSIVEIIVPRINDGTNPFVSDTLLIFRGDGQDAGNPQKLYVPGKILNWNPGPAVGDVNGDGIIEMLLPCNDHYLRVFSNYTPGANSVMTLIAISSATQTCRNSHPSLVDLDHDGISEVIVENDIYKFDFSIPTNIKLTRVLNGAGHSGLTLSSNSALSSAADLLSVADCNGDPDCEGLELLAGGNIYSIDLDLLDGDGYEMKIQRNINTMQSTFEYLDGYSYTADLNLDGVLDVVTYTSYGSPNYTPILITWNKDGFIDVLQYSEDYYYPLAIANVFDDREKGYQKDFPEIIAISSNQMKTFNLQAAAATPATPYWWAMPVEDLSGHSGISTFDFNGDGFAELLYRDESHFRIMYGGSAPFPEGVQANRNWFSQPCYSSTIDEYPVVADIDGDKEAEIVLTGRLTFQPNDYQIRGRLWVVESDSLPWQPARSLWNQYQYNGVNINDDLTIPKYQQAHHLEFPGLGSGKRPFNTAQTQWSTWNNDFNPLNPVPDAALTVDSFACAGDSLQVWLRLCNQGSNTLPANLPIAFYQKDPRQAGAVLKGTSLAQTAVPVDSCASFSVKIAAVFNAPIFVVANDNGSHPLPYAIADFPITAQPECDFENNFDAFVFNHQSPSLDLGPDRSLCSSSVTTLNAGADFSSYRWQDGTTDSTFTAFGPGTYWVDVKDGCGNLQSDTVHIFLNQTATIELGNDLTICEGESIQLNVPGFANVQWSPADGLSCANCPNPTAAPNADFTYYVTAANGNCFASDSIHVFLAQKPVLTLVAQDGDCLNGPQISVSAMGTAPLGFVWSNGGTGTTISPSVSGNYTVTVTTSLGCEATATAFVMAVNSLAVDLQTTSLNCSNGVGTATATASGGTAPFAYNWSNGGNAAAVSVTSPGTIGVTVTDANGCISSTSATVGMVGQLQLDISSTPISCNSSQGGAATVLPINGTAPFSYIWSDGGNAPTVSVTSPSTISVTVTDANGCISSTSATVGVAGQLQLGINITPISCHDSQDGTATVQPVNGTAPFTWLWANGTTSPQLTGLASGIYSVIVTDAIGCTDDLSFTIAAPTALALGISADGVSCFGEMDGAATVVAAGGTPGYQYLWSNFQTTATASQLGQGLQSVTVTDENGCTDTASVFISEPSLLTAAVQADAPVVCPDSTTNIAAIPMGGTPPYAFSWPGGQTDSLINNVGAGDYAVTVTDENGCTANASVAIQSQQLAVLVQDSVVAASSPTAADGSIFVEFSGGQPPFSYLWSSGDTSQNLLSVPAGDYLLTLSDPLGCEQTFPFTVDFLNAASQKLGKAWAASILPNPSAGGGVAQLAIQSNWPQNIDYQLFELTGKLLWEERIQVSAGYQLHPITTPSTAGVYLAVLSNERDVVCLKWVVMD